MAQIHPQRLSDFYCISVLVILILFQREKIGSRRAQAVNGCGHDTTRPACPFAAGIDAAQAKGLTVIPAQDPNRGAGTGLRRGKYRLGICKPAQFSFQQGKGGTERRCDHAGQ